MLLLLLVGAQSAAAVDRTPHGDLIYGLASVQVELAPVHELSVVAADIAYIPDTVVRIEELR